MTNPPKKRNRLTDMIYDEISLVDKGANQHANVVIVKRDAAGRSGGKSERKADWYSADKARNPDIKGKSKEGDWDESKHPREPSGSPAGGEFSETSEESKEKYGKDGTTKEKLERTTANHTTVKGDTLWALAVKHYGDGTQWDRIAEANDIENPKKLPVGKELKIPGSDIKREKLKSKGGKGKGSDGKVQGKKRGKSSSEKTEVEKLAFSYLFENYTGRG